MRETLALNRLTLFPAEAYSERCQMSKMELSRKQLTIKHLRWSVSRKNYFRKKLDRRCLIGL